MKQIRSVSGLIAVISLLLGVIWLGPAFAADAPTFSSLGDLRATGMAIPKAMALDGAGNLFVADVDSGLVYTFDQYGSFVRSYDVGANGLGVAVAGSRMFVSMRGGEVAVVDVTTGEQIGVLDGSPSAGPEFGAAGDIDLGPAGEYLYVADTVNRVVKIYHVSGGYVAEVGGVGTVAGTFSYIGSMAVAPTGQIVVADGNSMNFKVHVLTLDADFAVIESATVVYENTDANVFGAELSSPAGIAFDDQGRAYFLEYIKSEIRVVDVSGAPYTHLVTYAKPGKHVGQLYAVGDVVYDAVNKRLFVSCDGGRVEVFGIDGGTTPVYVNHAPMTPGLQWPVAGSEVASVNPTLVINNATDDAKDEDGDALTYDVIVRQNGGIVYQADVAVEIGATTSVVVDVALAENAAFTWTVQASDGDKSSAVSPAANFVVNAVEEAPTVPVLDSPVNGESIGGMDALSWFASTDPDPNDSSITYLVEVALDAEFAQIVATEAPAETALVINESGTYSDLVGGTTYFWRVTALDAAQVQSASSAAGRFVYNTTSLSISANMPDAVVSFYGNHAYAGQSVGVAPLEFRDMAPGVVSVVVERAGFEPFVTQVTLLENASVDLYAELVPAMAVSKLSAGRNGINGRSGLSVSSDAAPFLVDFDNDGDLDLLVGDGSGDITLFANMQMAGSNRLYFDNGTTLLSVAQGAVPFVADWNNDGRKDLIVGLAGGTVRLFTNTGSEAAPAFDGGFDLLANGTTLSVVSNAAPAVVDYDGDSDKDLLVANGSGQIIAYENTGADAAPMLAKGVELFHVNDAVVPLTVDWDADGQQELLLTANGDVTVYELVDGVYQAGQKFSDRRSDYFGAFPIDLDGSGKNLLAGQSNGELVYLTGKSSEPVASFHVALQDKVAELADLVAVEAAVLSDDVSAISVLVAAENYVDAAAATSTLLSALPDGAAQQSAMELLALL
jgi:hypothetical protein